MEASQIDEIFQRVERVPEIAEKLKKVSADEKDIVFGHVVESAQPFVVAMIARHVAHRSVRTWVICATERMQERFQGELACWLPDVILFPHQEVAAVEGAIPDPEITAERLGALQRLAKSAASVVVINKHSLDERVPSVASIQHATLQLRKGMRINREQFLGQIQHAGYENVPQVSERGQLSVRGGVIDIYSWHHLLPVRLEWFDDEIESIREFALNDQSSVRTLGECSMQVSLADKAEAKLRTYLNKSDSIISIEDSAGSSQITITSLVDQTTGGANQYNAAFFDSPLATKSEVQQTTEMVEAARKYATEQMVLWQSEGFLVVISCLKRSELNSVEKIISNFTGLVDKVILLESTTLTSFICPSAKVALVSSAEILGEGSKNRVQLGVGSRRGLLNQRSQVDFTELAEGDLVVHLEYGLALFRGIEAIADATRVRKARARTSEQRLVLEFADKAKLFVPLEQAFLVSKYVGLGKRGVALSKLGDGKWTSTKKAAETSIYDYAAQLLKVQARRELHPGFVFGPDGAWQREFEETFPYRETGDQIRAIDETKADMESGLPMDRLICGDVGFGKTEVAIRAAFKAATQGKQVAVLVPTTVLAQQHYENFSARMARFPVTVELMSRYRSRAEQMQVAEGLRDGSVDLVIGTHRLISQDISFKDLGLLVVDEEQRFGVRHKERIKERFPHVDVITLSATPIPRTLYMALTGARALSTLETPPPNRYPVETVICAYDERVIRTAIDRELDRQGQVYFLHNRVEDIERVGARIRHLCPQAKVDLGHGQMEEGQLEDVMHRFVSGKTDVLVATTIIESGLDIPNANTIIIDRADRFGLADLYQLRGRVGRSNHKAYAYLMLPRDLLTVGEARKRINAIKQYSALGAGFKIAMRDLEIRGAGNILGVAQSGHLTAVGFDLYCQLLRQAVGKLKGEKVRPRAEVTLRLDFVATSEIDFLRGSADATDSEDEAAPVSSDGLWPAFLPSSYIEEPRLRIQAYRQVAEAARREDVDKLKASWRDRFGRLPEAAENLLQYTRFKLLAASRKLQQVEVQDTKLMLTRGADFVLVGGRFPRLTSTDPVSKMRELFALVETL